MSRAKHWCITINNPGQGSIPHEDNYAELFQYLILGVEKGKEGTEHLQGYCVLQKKLSLIGVKKLFPTAHLEVARGTPKQASEYCKKDGDFSEYGVLPETAGEVNRARMKKLWAEAFELAKAGKMQEIEPYLLVPHYHAFKRIAQDFPVQVGDLDAVCGIWLHGKSGAGKSHKARADYVPFYDKPLNKWWDGYRGQPNILIDDLGPDAAKWIAGLLKRWSDRYSFPAEVKGTTIQIRPKKIIVTSQWTIDCLFFGEDCEAIARRFTEIHVRKLVDAFPKRKRRKT